MLLIPQDKLVTYVAFFPANPSDVDSEKSTRVPGSHVVPAPGMGSWHL